MSASLPTVLFVCTSNAGRSQIAQALFNREVGGRALARSAGSEPNDTVHSNVVAALAEVGIDLAGAKPQLLSPAMLEGVDVVVGMGRGDDTPMIAGARKLDWDLPETDAMSVHDVRMVRDEIERLVRKLLVEMHLL